jgi:hypothetical protein
MSVDFRDAIVKGEASEVSHFSLDTFVLKKISFDSLSDRVQLQHQYFPTFRCPTPSTQQKYKLETAPNYGYGEVWLANLLQLTKALIMI